MPLSVSGLFFSQSGGFIATAAHSASAPFWFSGMLGMINVLLVTFFLPETRKVSAIVRQRFHLFKGISNIRAAFRDHDARPVYFANFLFISGFAFFTSFIGILLVNRFGQSESQIGTFFGFVGIWIVITQGFILRVLSKRYSERSILRVTLIFLAVTIACYPFVPCVLAFCICSVSSIPNGLSMANMTALISKSVSVDKQGAAPRYQRVAWGIVAGVRSIACWFRIRLPWTFNTVRVSEISGLSCLGNSSFLPI